ncbi:MAG: DUF4249 family protein [Niabella sp.]
MIPCCVWACSCQKVIQVDAESGEKQYVIEATITNESYSCRVNLSQTIDFDDFSRFTGVDSADITIAEDDEPPVKLFESEKGVYLANMSAQEGHTYSLTVNVGDSTFSAVSIIPEKVSIDSLYITERSLLGKTRKIAIVTFRDPPGPGNAYRFIQYVDGRKENTVFITNDNLIDGFAVAYDLLVADDDYTLYTGQTVKVELLGISAFMYQYWYSLSQSSLGQSQSASPGNPVSQFSDGALGYFSAHTYDVKTIKVK